MPSVTFEVSERPIADEPGDAIDVNQSVQSLLHRRIEAMALSDNRLIVCNDAHPFAQAARDAFYQHYPLTIGPDDIWFCIAQGFAQHVNLNSEQLRHRFVKHEGKKKLLVERPDFILGTPNPWPEVFTQFSRQIAANVGDELRNLIVADFSTTTEFHRAATEVALMDTFQGYFEYEMLCGCGIPSITLTGAPDDWRDVRRRAKALADYGLQDWIAALVPVLDQIEAASRGFSDREFWKSFFRYRSGSFGTAMTGWIHVLFPYLKDFKHGPGALKPNPYYKTWAAEYARALASDSHSDWRERDSFSGPVLLEIPSGLSSAPVLVNDGNMGESHNMRFVAGMFGVSQDSRTRSLFPSFGWAIVYDEPTPQEKHKRGRWSVLGNWLGRE